MEKKKKGHLSEKEKPVMQDDRIHQRSKGRTQDQSPKEELLRLAATAVSCNVRLRSSDMPVHMQERALRCTRSFLDSSSPNLRPNNTHLARALKKEFDSVYGPAWHCVVGKSFGSFVTHSPGGFLYFSLDSLSVLLFQTVVQLVTEPTRS
ncbi:dynein light chain, cytoplasmic-like isoform X2 [Rhodamnia argentea]|uniref:Dynein light chain n=1 Tax=Rhodamnia argentea TaxID=178133 RepID=A0A8B8QTV8_9MYRT|nr:dynein light chain, cytoplasmic-like isoform X2 [Rhodamnia argentea]